MTPTITIARRFRGPPDSGNGGYVCGRLASFIAGPAAVRLKVPPPLDAEMEVRQANGGVEMMHGDAPVATARASEFVLDVPVAPGHAAAETASRAFAGFRSNVFPGCFVCGHERKAGDGLRIFAGSVAGTNVVASPWVPDASLDDGDGLVRPEFIWSALDCPGAFAFEAPPLTAKLLGELTCDIRGSVAVGERCVVIGWEFAREGRKHHTGTAVFGESGECRGVGKATWFEVPLNR